jgi:hypothetical protein
MPAVKEKRRKGGIWPGGRTMSRIAGHCLCKAVCFEVEGEAQQSYHCHCESCRRSTSSPFTSYLTVRKSQLRWTAVRPVTYQSSSGVIRSFCGQCGSPMAYTSETRPDDIDLFAASLEIPESFNPEFHDFWSEKLPWVSVDDGLPQRD